MCSADQLLGLDVGSTILRDFWHYFNDSPIAHTSDMPLLALLVLGWVVGATVFGVLLGRGLGKLHEISTPPRVLNAERWSG